MSRELGGETQPCPKCTSVWKASYEREKSKRVDLDQKLSDARAALRHLLAAAEEVIMCADQDVVRFGIEVPADVAWKFAHAVGHCNKYLAGTTATVAIPAIDSITVSPEQYQAIEDAISKPAAPTQALVDLFRDARAITKRGGAK